MESGPAPMDLGAAERRDAWLRIGLLAAVLLLAGLIDATPERATLLGVEGPACPSIWVLPALGLPDAGCPGCGLTRATALTVQGDFGAAWSVNPVGAVVVLFAACGIAVHATTLLRGRKSAWTFRLLRSGRVLFAAALLFAWLAR